MYYSLASRHNFASFRSSDFYWDKRWQNNKRVYKEFFVNVGLGLYRGVATWWPGVDTSAPLFPKGLFGIESLWSVLISFRFPDPIPRLGRVHPSPHSTHTVHPTLFDLATPLGLCITSEFVSPHNQQWCSMRAIPARVWTSLYWSHWCGMQNGWTDHDARWSTNSRLP